MVSVSGSAAKLFGSYGSVFGEAGVFGPVTGDSPGWYGVFSVGAAAHMRKPSSALRPFVAGGYTIFGGLAPFWNVGLGVDVRLKPRVALRAEWRDYLGHYSAGFDHMWTVRTGVVLGG
jgi:hypothetical protein